MKQYFSITNIVFALALIVFIIGFSTFSQNRNADKFSLKKQQSQKRDNARKPNNRGWNDDDLDFDELDRQMKQLDTQMENLNNQLRNIDMQKYEQAMDKAMQDIDLEKINLETVDAMRETEWEKLNSEIEENISNAKELNTREMLQQMDALKTNLQNQKFTMQTKNMQAQINKSMKNAQQSLENAKRELESLKDFTDALQKDGLINKSKPYKIEVRKGELYIDGKKQPEEINKKYKKYYKKNDFNINMNANDDLWI